tara:strand:+ start:1163 stop:1768 length:606 start_codon:yes stop_codon:yes gene_type:complete
MKKNKLLFIGLMLSFCSVSANIDTVNASNFTYVPSALTINQNDTVVWINIGGFHDVNADINTLTGSSFGNPVDFQSASSGVGFLYQYIFTVSGTYNYDCSVGQHAANGMVGTINVLPLTAVAEATQKNSSSSFYPNPAKNVINFPDFNKIDQISIFSLTGEKVMETKLIKQQLNLNDLSSGVYFVKISKNNKLTTTKLVIK